MAEPAKKYDQTPGNADSAPPGRPQLRALEGGGETSEPDHSWYTGDGQEGGEEPDEKGKLAKSEKAGTNFKYRADSQKSGGWFRRRTGSRLDRSKRLRRYLLVGGFSAGIVAFIIVLFSFLNFFKLPGLMAEIEQRAFLRNEAGLSRRSDTWISEYIEARMFEVPGKPGDSVLFRSDKVDTGHFFRDWYKTLRTSNFEQKVFEQHGIKFTSVIGPDGHPRLGKIDINGEKSIDVPIKDSDITKIQAGDIETLSKYQKFFDLDTIDGNKSARAAIKDVVNKNIPAWQVFKRRMVRKAIQNMTGVTDWRFFDNTRTKIEQKKIDMRNKIIDKMVPDSILLGRVTRCLFGVDKCNSGRDPANSENQVAGSGTQTPSEEEPQTSTEKENEKNLSAGLDSTVFSDSLKKILNAANIFNKVLNIPSNLDMLAAVNKGMSSIVKYVVIARGAQAAGLFQVFETSADQIKAGQANTAEVNQMMQLMSTSASSDGWTKVVEDQGSPATPQTGGACSNTAQALEQKNPQQFQKQYGSYAPLCASQQIGSASHAQDIQTAYNQSVGKIIGPVATAWGSLKSNIIFGKIVSVLEKINGVVNVVIEKAANGLLGILGLQNDVKGAMEWMFGKVANFLGISIMQGYESAGTILNWLVQGGAYTAEATARDNGAALTNPQSQATAQNVVAEYQSDQQSEASLYDKVASLNNTNSLAFKTALAASNVQSNPIGSLFSGLHSLPSSIFKNFANLFSGHVLAKGPDGYAASQFAGIDTYDYPQQCYDLDPLTATPIDGTNALDVFANPSKYGLSNAPISVSPDNIAKLNSGATETNASDFYSTIYSIIGQNTPNADDIAVQIYNCNLFDSAVRGSLGAPFGYTQDNGLN